MGVFKLSFTLEHYTRLNQVVFGSNSLQSLGPRIWNEISNDKKSEENLNSFKRMIKKWIGPNCKCNSCQYVSSSLQSIFL